MLRETTTNTFKEDIAKDTVLVDFWAEWCGPCRILHPILEEIQSERNDLKIISLDIDKSPDIAVELGVQSIPTMILFKDGQEVKRIVGALPKRDLEKAIDES